MTVLATETWTGTTGAAWPAQWTTSGTTSINANRGALTTTGAAYTPTVSSTLSGMAATRDIDVTVDVTFNNIDEQYWYLFIRASVPSGASTPSDGYAVDFYPGNGTASVGVSVFAAGNETALASNLAGGQWVAGTAKRVRFQAIANTVQLKIWDPAGAEPGTWLYSTTNGVQSAATGKVTFVGAVGGPAAARTAYLDNLTVTDGVTSANGSGTLTLTGSSSTTLAASTTLAGTLALTGSSTTTLAGTSAVAGTLALTGSGTLTIDGTGAVGGALALAGSSSTVLTGTGTVAGAGTVTFTGNGVTQVGQGGYLYGTGTLTIGGTGSTVATPFTGAKRGSDWSAFARGTDYGLTAALPITSATVVLKHMGLDKASLTTPFNTDAWNAVQPARSIALYRAGRQIFAGPVTSRTLTWSAADGTAVIALEAVGDEVVLADRLAMPDPSRAGDDQTVNDYWTFTGTASTAMRQLISDQAGIGANASRQVPGLVLGVDPNVGTYRTWTGLFDPVLDLLATMAAASGADLGLRTTSAAGALTCAVVAPRNLMGTVIFSANLSNIGSVTFTENAPTVSTALVAGQGDLHARQRLMAGSTDDGTTRWGRQVWSYVDRRDTADVAKLATAASDALVAGQATVSLTLTLLDSDAASYGTDWDLGDAVTAYVGTPGSTVAQVDDVIRELTFTVGADGSELIRPAIGSVAARTYLPTPAQRAITATAQQVSALTRNK